MLSRREGPLEVLCVLSLLLPMPLRAEAIPFLPLGLFVGLEGRLGDLVGRWLLDVRYAFAKTDQRCQPKLLFASRVIICSKLQVGHGWSSLFRGRSLRHLAVSPERVDHGTITPRQDSGHSQSMPVCLGTVWLRGGDAG